MGYGVVVANGFLRKAHTYKLLLEIAILRVLIVMAKQVLKILIANLKATAFIIKSECIPLSLLQILHLWIDVIMLL